MLGDREAELLEDLPASMLLRQDPKSGLQGCRGVGRSGRGGSPESEAVMMHRRLEHLQIGPISIPLGEMGHSGARAQEPS